MIVKIKSADNHWHLYDDAIDVSYEVIKPTEGKKQIVKYNVLRRRGFDFSGETDQTIYVLNDEGKTIERLN